MSGDLGTSCDRKASWIVWTGKLCLVSGPPNESNMLCKIKSRPARLEHGEFTSHVRIVYLFLTFVQCFHVFKFDDRRLTTAQNQGAVFRVS